MAIREFIEKEDIYDFLMNESGFQKQTDILVEKIKKALAKSAEYILSGKFHGENYNCYNIPQEKLSFMAFSCKELIVANFSNKISTFLKEENKAYPLGSTFKVSEQVCKYFETEINLGNY